jgi:hypothetical protein
MYAALSCGGHLKLTRREFAKKRSAGGVCKKDSEKSNFADKENEK